MHFGLLIALLSLLPTPGPLSSQALYRQRIEAAYRSGFALLARIPSTNVWRTLSYVDSLSAEERNDLFDSCADIARAHVESALEEAMKLVIRKAERSDAMIAWDIRNAAILAQCAGHYPEDQLAAWAAGEITEEFIRSVAGNWYVATRDDTVVGTGMLDCATGRIDGIFVRPDNMGRGVGRAIMAHLELLAIESGLTRLTLDSTLNAAPFYRRCGFVGELRSLYNSPRGVSLVCIPMVKQCAI